MKRQVPLAKWFGPVMTKFGIWESLKFTCVCIYFTTYLFTPAFLRHITHFTFFPHKNAPCLLQEASLLVNLDIFCSVIADLQTMPPYNPTHLIFKLAGFVKFVRYSSIQIFQMFSLANGYVSIQEKLNAVVVCSIHYSCLLHTQGRLQPFQIWSNIYIFFKDNNKLE